MSEPNPYANSGPDKDGYEWGPAHDRPQGPGYPVPAQGWGVPGAGYGYPAGPGAGPSDPPALAGGSPLLTIGDITVVNNGTIVTPSGTMPLRGAVWSAMDLSRTEETIPTHAIVLAVVFFVFCFLGLLFLLMKERRTTGFIQVTVASGGRHHTTMVPAAGPYALHSVMEQLAYARSISV